MHPSMPVVLSIAGSDPTAGAGIQADLKVFTLLNTLGTTVVSAVTAQNSTSFGSIYPLSKEQVETQLQTVLDEFNPLYTKTGMLGTPEIGELVAKYTKNSLIGKLIVDPVLKSSSGTYLLEKSAQSGKATGGGHIEFLYKNLYTKTLFPLSFIVTPNIPEASILAGIEVRDVDTMEEAARSIHKTGARIVVITGGHLKGDQAIDLVFDGRRTTLLKDERFQENRNFHGTGCVFSAALTAWLARGYELLDALGMAKKYVHEYIRL